MTKWLDAAQAADKLGYRSRSAFYKAVERHNIPHVRIGTALRFSEARLDQFMEMLGKRPAPMRRTG